MYSLLSIFIIIPLIFSHTFARLGESFIIENGIGSFESVKVSVFFVLIFCATTEIAISKNEFFSKKTIILLSGIIGFILFEYTLFGPESVFGIGEKQHGSLFFASLLWFGYLLSQVVKNHQKLFIDTIISTALIVSLIAIVEYLFSYNIFSGFIDNTGSTWGNGRATATLGNPNYVAGYLLMAFPLIHSLKNKSIGFIVTILLSAGILSTGSVIGIVLLIFSFTLLFLGKKYSKWTVLKSISFLTILFIVLIFYFHETEKWLSFISRFVLMKETIIHWFENLPSSLIGFGPNGIIDYYNSTRSASIEAYFSNNLIIDSSHNIFLDFLFKFGILGAVLPIYFSAKKWKKIPNGFQLSLVLGVTFFSLNVAVLSAYILFIFAFLQVKEEL